MRETMLLKYRPVAKKKVPANLPMSDSKYSPLLGSNLRIISLLLE